MKILNLIGAVIAALVLLLIVVPGIIGIGMTVTFKLLQLALYLVLGWVMIHVLDDCFKKEN